MKYIHLPTLAMHIALLGLALLTINNYPDLFLGCSIAVLTAHLIWALRSKRSFHITHIMGLCLYVLAPTFGLVGPDSGAFGLGGGEYAWYFYCIALDVSIVAVSILAIVRWIKKR